MNRKWIAVVTLLALMLSVCVLALAEEPTDPVYPNPGPLEEHEHTVSIKIVDRGYTAHRLHEWCPDCRRLLKERLEKHSFVDGVCTVCDWECPHPPEAAEKHYERDGVKPQWDGNYIIGPGWEITECSLCHTELSRVETTVREFHNVHTHFTPVLECLPHDADTHALIRYCDECGTEVPEYVPHNCPPSDRPYKDDGNSETHSRLVRCADCGFWVPQQQAHTWVHDSYRKDDTDGGEEGHIEVMKCTVCGAKKAVWRPHGTGTHVAYRQDGNDNTHIEVLQCPLCNETFETEQPHELEHASYRSDGNTKTHIDVFVCTLCEAEVEKRGAHKPMHLYWKSISDTQDQETVRCNMCGLTYILAPSVHEYTTSSPVYNSNGADSHNRYNTCHCGAVDPSSVQKEAHVYYGNNKTCHFCGEPKVWHVHQILWSVGPSEYRSLNAEQHVPYYHCIEFRFQLCDVNLPADPQPHNFDPVTLKCTACGYLKEGCEHKYTYKPVKDGVTADEHTVIGTCIGCGKEITVTGKHDMQFVSRTDYRPCENGHAFTVTDRCTYCGYETTRTETEAHTIRTDAKPIDDDTHLESCELCSYTAEAAHSFIDMESEDKHRCKYCGFEQAHVYSGSKQWIDIDDTYHGFVDYCETCHHQRIEKEEHKPYRCDRFLDDKYHELYYRCDVCNRYLTQGKKKEAHKEYKTFFRRSATHHLVCMRCDVCYSSYGAYYEPHNFVLQGDKYVCKDCGYQQ